MPRTDRARLAAVLVPAGVAAFWTGTVLAGALAPGYSARVDYISSLASRGSSVAVLGVATLAVLGSTHLVAAVAVRRADGPAWAVAVLLALAGAAGLVVAAFRISCPVGAAGCGFTPGNAARDTGDVVHGLAVVSYEVALVAAMLVTAARLARSRTAAAVATLLAAAASVTLALRIGGPDTGWWQRGWLVVNTGWLLVLVLTERSRAPRSTAR